MLALSGAAYMGAGLFTADGGGPQRSFTVTEEEVSFTAHAEGLVLREERALCSRADFLLVTARDGERLPGGAAAAFELGSAEEYARAREIAAESLPAPATAEEAALALAEAKYGSRGGLSAALDALEGLLTEGVAAAAPETEAAGTGLYVDGPGLFSASADGFTGLLPGDCASPEALSALLASEPEAPEGAFGSLVTGLRWHFAALLGEEAAAGLVPGGTAELSFPEGEFSARVESVSEPVRGSCAVLFSCAEGLADMLRARRTEAELLVTRARGLYVPREAVYERGGEYFVRALLLDGEVETAVEPLCEYGGGYLVESQGLHAGSEVLLNGRGTYSYADGPPEGG